MWFPCFSFLWIEDSFTAYYTGQCSKRKWEQTAIVQPEEVQFFVTVALLLPLGPKTAGEAGHGVPLQLQVWHKWNFSFEEVFFQIQKGIQYFSWSHGCHARALNVARDIFCSQVFWEQVGSFGWVRMTLIGTELMDLTQSMREVWVRLTLFEVWISQLVWKTTGTATSTWHGVKQRSPRETLCTLKQIYN